MALLRNVSSGVESPLRGILTTIGRDPECDIVSPSPLVSGRHAIILCRDGICHVEDLESLNGTLVNGERLDGRRLLHPGDRIDVLGMIMEFVGEAPNTGDAFARPAPSPASAQPLDATGPRPSAWTLPVGGATIRLSDLARARRVPEQASLPIDGDLRLSVSPEKKLRAVLEIARCLSHSVDLPAVLPLILESLFSIFPQADCGFVLLQNARTGDLIPAAVRSRGACETGAPSISRGIVHQTLQTGRAILSHDAAADAQLSPSASVRQLDIRSVMCVPIRQDDGECMGVIQLDSRDRSDQFDDDDLALLVCASLLVSRAVDAARMHEERREQEAATQIQRSLMPSQPPAHSGLRLFHHYAPAGFVSGDYFDYVSLSGNRLAVVIGDVAGKGLAAALLMSHLAAAVRICLPLATSIADAVQQLNRQLLHTVTDDRFVTLIVAVLDPDHSEVCLVNAGHPPAMIRRAADGSVMELTGESAGLPLGVCECRYQELRAELSPGDVVLLYTDGVSERRSPLLQFYGTERLQRVMQRSAADPDAIGLAVLDDLEQFGASRPVGDDTTLVCAGRSVRHA